MNDTNTNAPATEVEAPVQLPLVFAASDYSGDEFPASEMIEVKDYGLIHISEATEEEGFAQCAERGTWHDLDDMVKTHDGEYICQDEYGDNWGTCEETDGVFHNERLHEVYHLTSRGDRGSRTVCDSVRDGQYRSCEHSGEMWRFGDMQEIRRPGLRRHFVAQYYISNGDVNCTTCTGCGDVFYCDDISTHRGEELCPNCLPEDDEDEDDTLIREYGCTRYPKACRCDNEPDLVDTLYAGVELEVEVVSGFSRRELAREVAGALSDDHAILKSDGSLNNGFEIVTAPATFEYHYTKLWENFFNQSWDGLKSWDTSTCGMHVHISKAALSPLQIGRIVVFINDDANRRFITDIAGRPANTYCQTKPRRFTQGKPENTSHYDAVSTSNDDTVEIRIFRGSLNRLRVFSNLEFVEALVKFTGTGVVGLTAGRSYVEFCTFVQTRRKDFPNLFNHLVSKSYLPALKTKPTKI